MANFGLSDLAVAAPHPPVWKEALTENRAAVGAGHLLERAAVSGSIPSAADGCSLVLGTSALNRRSPDREVIPLPLAARYIRKNSGGGRTALVFGPEKHGLTEADLSHCRAIIAVPTDDAQPSMNLGHAVAVVCYELAGRDAGATRGAAGREKPEASPRELEAAAEEIAAFLERTGGGKSPAQVRRAVQDIAGLKQALGLMRLLARRASKL
ncbi:MAG: tRNA/rRNA methyltransferase [Elusimicrobia bacterium]|nr:MAG: tRNA/rRNA methyltransferase [Elusimicrobiota bacterium]KAF0156836.1 MAG: tRNA/rRNA methyltransferase [Elusimicrobiota bacterium]